MTFAKPDNPLTNKNVTVTLKVDNLTVEQCSDVLVSMANLIPDYRTILRYDDIHQKPSKVNLETRVRMLAPIYYLRNQIVKSKFTSD